MCYDILKSSMLSSFMAILYYALGTDDLKKTENDEFQSLIAVTFI